MYDNKTSQIKVFFVLFFVYFILSYHFSCKHESINKSSVIIDTNTFTPSINSNKLDSVCFEEMIQPMILSSCVRNGCHNGNTHQSGINLSSYENLKATISGDLLLQSIQDVGQLRMPPEPYPQFNKNQIGIISKWINEGMKKGIDCEGPCDTLNITFLKTILPIIQNNCLGCHSNGVNDMSSYAKIKIMVDNGKFSCTINHNLSCQPMPQNAPKLSTCKLIQIKKWIAAGAPNN